MLEKTRVLHVLPYLLTGGAEKLVVDLTSGYDENRFELAVLSLHAQKGTMFEKVLQERGIKLMFLDKKPGLDVSLFKKVGRVLDEYDPQVVHSHLSVLRYTLLPCMKRGIKARVHTFHSIAEKEQHDKIGVPFQKIAMKHFNVVPVAISDLVRESIEKFYGISEVPVIYNGIDMGPYENLQRVEDDVITFVTVGRLVDIKNQQLLIRAFKKLSDKHDNIRLNIAGGGPLEEELRSLVAELQLQDKVKLLGIRKDVANLLAESDVFAMTSLWEGLPMVILEALAAGLPIVSTDVGGIKDVVTNGENGILVQSENLEELVDAMEKLIEDENLRKTFGENNRACSKQYDIRNIQAQYQKLYMSILNK